MKVLLTDGSGLTARQVAGRLAAMGQSVDVLSPDPMCLCRFTRHVHRVHHVPAYGVETMAWLEAALLAYREGSFDVLFPTQEQVALLAAVPERLAAAGVVTMVPNFSALASVQDKASAIRTLNRFGLPQPHSQIGTAGWEQFPAFLKQPIGTASGGVRRVDSSRDITPSEHAAPDLVVQALVEGPLAMCQAVFNRGSMVAFHANLRTGEGASGGASRKCSVSLPDARSWMEVLGSGLQWHGALSADVIVSTAGVKFIDINPRLVEPINAWFDGVDLVGAMLDLAQGAASRAQNPAGGPVRTHQLLLAVLGAAQHGKGRRGVWAELRDGMSHRGEYKESREELTQLRGDPLSAIPLVMASVATMIRPDAYQWFTSGSVSNYALTADAWRQICDMAPRN